MNTSDKSTWAHIRQQGKSRYLLTRGVLPFGIGITLMLGIVESASQHVSITIWTPIRLIIFGYLGFVIANGRWQSKERKYNASR